MLARTAVGPTHCARKVNRYIAGVNAWKCSVVSRLRGQLRHANASFFKTNLVLHITHYGSAVFVAIAKTELEPCCTDVQLSD